MLFKRQIFINMNSQKLVHLCSFYIRVSSSNSSDNSSTDSSNDEKNDEERENLIPFSSGPVVLNPGECCLWCELSGVVVFCSPQIACGEMSYRMANVLGGVTNRGIYFPEIPDDFRGNLNPGI